MAEGEEQEHRILEDLLHQVEGDEVAGKMNPGQRKKLFTYYWLIVIAASVIILNNNIDSAPKDQLFPPEFPMFVVLLCAVYLILRAMNQLMI